MRISDWSSDVCSSDLLVMALFIAGQMREHFLAHRFDRSAQAAGVGMRDLRGLFLQRGIREQTIRISLPIRVEAGCDIGILELSQRTHTEQTSAIGRAHV